MQENKTALARSLGISRSTLYYKPKQPEADQRLKEDILAIWPMHPAYGYRRVALHLSINKKRAQRVMHKYGIRPRLIRKRGRYGRKSSASGIPNRLREVRPDHPNMVWAGDFTYLWYKGRYIYLATVLDVFTREIIGWQIGLHHTTRLVIDVLIEAKRKRETMPTMFHIGSGIGICKFRLHRVAGDPQRPAIPFTQRQTLAQWQTGIIFQFIQSRVWKNTQVSNH